MLLCAHGPYNTTFGFLAPKPLLTCVLLKPVFFTVHTGMGPRWAAKFTTLLEHLFQEHRRCDHGDRQHRQGTGGSHKGRCGMGSAYSSRGHNKWRQKLYKGMEASTNWCCRSTTQTAQYLSHHFCGMHRTCAKVHLACGNGGDSSAHSPLVSKTFKSKKHSGQVIPWRISL